MSSSPPPPSLVRAAAASMRGLFDRDVPSVLREVGPLFCAEEVFAWIKRAHPPARADAVRNKLAALRQTWGVASPPGPKALGPEPNRDVDLYLDGNIVLGSSRYLPSGAQDFDAWIQTTRERLGGGSFGMQAPGLECTSWTAFHRLRALLEPMLELTGPRSFRYNAFLGDYRRTPLGFHADPHHEGVFQYILVGARRGLFWDGLSLADTDAAWLEQADPSQQPARPPEYVIELQPGDLVYWPGNYVHGFEAEGPSMALSMVVDRASPRMRDAIVSGLEFATVGGTAALPPVDEACVLTEGDVVDRAYASGLAYERYDDTLIVGVCGRTFDWPDFRSMPTATRLFDHLRAHERVVVGEVADAFADDSLPREDLIGLLSMLAAMGLLQPAAPEPRD